MNKSYCKMPFVGFQATHRGHRICCASKNVTSDSINDFWHSDYIKNVRSKMLKGEYVKECTSCYQSEEQGQISLRNHYNNRYKDFSENNLPTALDLDFSNLCNLKCIMCGPDRSSQWTKELGQKEIKPIGKKEIDKLCNISSNLQHLTIQGGEPSLMPEFEYYFEYLKNNNLIQNIEIDCISNLTNTNNKFYKLLAHFKKVNLNVSIDAYGTSNDYIRFPSNFKTIENNLVNLIGKDIQINLQITLQTLSMFNFYEFLIWINKIQKRFAQTKNKLGVAISYVKNPDKLNIKHAPKKLKQKMVNDIKAFKKEHNVKLNLSLAMELRNIEKTLLFYSEESKWNEIEEYVKILDNRRKINITTFIPDFYNYC